MTERAMGVTRACGLVGISRSLFQYESRRRVDDEALTGRMMVIAAQKRRYGYRRIHVLLRLEGWLANHKRIWRLYSKAGLSVRKRRRKRMASKSGSLETMCRSNCCGLMPCSKATGVTLAHASAAVASIESMVSTRRANQLSPGG
ncbi:IS3 family transposase [Caballeronia sp. INSB1]|uniref:IS3 family transposase n=1 Tax=Caballeronia sp. INSB1 TaxID=2921751 RepID=UPI002032D7A1|nr:IS3 family transposase [Caballeronia sp. INSB1]